MQWVGPDGTILRANQAELEFLGYAAADYIGHNIAQFHADKGALLDIVGRLRRKESVRDHEARMIRGDGGIVDVLVDATVLWRDGEFVHTRCITRDNTAQKAAESRVRASEERYRQIIETANEGVVIIDAEARITYANDRFAAMLGYDRDKLPGARVHDLTDDEGRAQMEANLARRRQGIAENFDFRFLHANGRPVWAIVSATPLTDAQGGFAGSLAMITDITQRRVAEDAVIESESRWRLLADSLPAMVSVSDARGRLEYCNQQLLRYTGFTREDLFDGSWLRMLHPDDMAARRAEWDATVGAGKAYSAEYRARRADGEYRWHLGVVEPIRDASGRIALWITAHIDIHDRKLAEAALQEKANLLEQTHDAVFVWAPSGGGLRYMNRAAEELYGYRRADALGKVSRELFRTEFPGDMPDIETVLLRDGQWTGELRHHTGDGRALVVESQQVMITTTDGERLVLETTRDITANRAAEQALRDSEARFRQLADAMPQIVWAARPDGQPDYFNRRWYDYTGFSEEEPFDSILHPDDAAFTRHIWLESVRTGEPYQIEYRFYDRVSGAYRWHLGRAMPVRNEAGDIVRWFGTSTDIDSQKRTEEALRRANEAKDEFLGLVSHELKTPITTIFGNAEVLRLRAEQLDAESRRAALEDIGSEADRLHRIVENLLVLARLDQGETVHVEPILIRRLVSKLIADHEHRFPHRKVTFDADTDIMPILGEPTYAEQVLRNLLSNAEKYSPPDRPVEITLRHSGKDLEVSVLDDGIGIDPAEAERLFTPFYRSARAARQTSGVGIGLAVCKRLIEVQGGRMWARPRPGGGADIGFALPIEASDGLHE